MSLSGLDSTAVNGAYSSALNEPGGWFLLKYSTRDEVDILAQGHGGFSEAADAVASYPDKSPLYGFLLYRRRKVILKYVPEGTSRLLLARTAVHFQAVQDRFSPHDAVFNATNAAEITDASLSASCSLHTANSVYSTTSSLRKQNLGGISEDAEDANNRTASPAIDDLHADHQAATAFQESFERPRTSVDKDSISSAANGPDSNRYHVPRKLETITSKEDVATTEIPRPGSAVPSEPVSVDDDRLSHDMEDRPDTSKQMYAWEGYYNGDTALAAKTKQGPRPVTNKVSRGPSTSSGARQKMPAGVKVSYRKHEDEQKREARKDNHSRANSSATATATAKPVGNRPIPAANETGRRTAGRTADGSNYANGVSQRPNEPPSQVLPERVAESAPPPVPLEAEPRPSRTSDTHPSSPRQTEPLMSIQPEILQAESSQTKPAEAKAPIMSPEKLRLMRALDLRKRQLAANGGSKAPAETTKADSAVGIIEPGGQPGKLSIQPQPALNQGASRAQATSPASLAARSPNFPRRPSETTSAATPTSPASGGLASSLADDDVINELQTVTVQKAKTIQVNAPEDEPVNHVDIKTGVSPARNGADRNTSQSPETYRGRRESSLSKPSTDQMSISKRANVSSGISRRIQALAQHSSKEASPALPSSPTLPTSPQRDEFPSEPSVPYSLARNLSMTSATRTNTMVRAPRHENRAESRAESRGTSPTRSIFRAFRSGSKTSHGPSKTSVYSSFVEPTKSEQRTITARIVRRPDTDSIETRLGQADATPNSFAPTPTIVSESAPRPHTTATTRPGSRDSFLSTMTAKSNWRAFGRRNKDSHPHSQQRQSNQSQAVFSSYQQGPTPQLVARQSFGSSGLERVEENHEEIKTQSSKTSRFMKRISGFPGARRNEKEGGRPENVFRKVMPTILPVRDSKAPPGFNVGDLNVQFPDSLLWKRRWVQVDGSGNLVLTSSRDYERPQTAFLKKYRLSEFRMPTIPSQERQELPWSVVLDFVTGGSLQFACGDSLSQSSILKRLIDAWDAWTAIDR